MHIKTEDFYKDIANDVERWFNTPNYDEKDNRPLLIGKNKKVIGKFKDEIGRKIMRKFQPDIDKIYLYAKDPYEDKYQYLINKRECVGINHLSDPKAFIILMICMMFLKILIIIILTKKIKY